MPLDWISGIRNSAGKGNGRPAIAVTFASKRKAMMTKEEIAEIVAYCDEHKISHKQRLTELGIPTWKFYDSKRKYVPREEDTEGVEFMQLIPGGTFLPNPIKPSRTKSSKQKVTENAVRPLAIGRKNYLFCGNHDAGIRVAIIYSLIGSYKALDVNPREWMEDVLLRIPRNEANRTALRELLPEK